MKCEKKIFFFEGGNSRYITMYLCIICMLCVVIVSVCSALCIYIVYVFDLVWFTSVDKKTKR